MQNNRNRMKQKYILIALKFFNYSLIIIVKKRFKKEKYFLNKIVLNKCNII